MRVLLDESVPKPLAPLIEGHEVWSVQQMGWASVQNGALLRLAVAEGFDALVTGDRNFEHQQNIAGSGIGLVVLIARSNKREDTLPLAPLIAAALASLRPGQVIRVGEERHCREDRLN